MENLQPVQFIETPEALFERLKAHKLTESRIFILADSKTSEHCLPLIQDTLPGEGRNAILLNIPEGEASKQIATVSHLYDRLLEYRADRSSVLLNVGGGVVSDIGSFVASTYKRGMKWINLPTTVLGQVDAAIGGKTGINHMGYKNMVGTFAYPLDTIIYTDFLNTLPKREVLSGFAEMMKHALIKDPELWQAMCSASFIDLPFIKQHLSAAIDVKRQIVAQDFLESSERKKLNFGHTVGHALESYMMESAGRDPLHGEAVALGIVAESHISYQKGYISESVLSEITGFIASQYDGLDIHENQYHRLIEIMRQDKKSEGSKLNMTLIKGIGKAVVNQNPSMDMIIDALTYLLRYPFEK